LEALKERITLEALAKKYKPTQISKWKAEALSNFENVFSGKKGALEKKKEADLQMLYAQIGEQKMAIDFLKKNCYETIR
jgi:hypothetical protein